MKGGPFDALQLPYDADIERKVLSSSVYAPEWYDGLGVRREDFFFEAHRAMHDAVEALRLRGTRKDLNFPNVKLELERLRRDNGWDMSRWQRLQAALQEVIAAVGKPTELEVTHLRELSLCRQVSSAMSNVADAITGGDVRKVREALEAACDAADAEELDNTYTMHDLAKMAFDSVEHRDREVPEADLGFTHLRGHLGGVAPGFLITVGARPNVGKSGVALAMSDLCIPHGTRPGYISLEDPSKIVGTRGLAMRSGVSPRSMMRKTSDDIDLSSLRRGVEMWQDVPFFVEFPKKKDHQSVKHAMRRLARRGVNLVFIDYLQVIRYAEKGIDRVEAVGYMLSEFKSLGDELGMAIVMLCQLRRRGDDDRKRRKRSKHQVELNRPNMEELKGAGDIEEKSDIVLLMWRDTDADDAPVHIEIAKGKWGGVGHTFDVVRGRDAVLREVETYEEWQQKKWERESGQDGTGPRPFF